MRRPRLHGDGLHRAAQDLREQFALLAFLGVIVLWNRIPTPLPIVSAETLPPLATGLAAAFVPVLPFAFLPLGSARTVSLVVTAMFWRRAVQST